MKASRLVETLLLLQARGSATADELAGELGVSVRTVYRDVQALADAGIPVYGEAGHRGGYRLVEGYRTKLTGLSRPEAEALAFAGIPGAAEDLGLGSVLTTARLKLMAALPAELRDRAEYFRQRFHLDTSSWYAEPDPVPHLAALVAAACDETRSRIRYRRWQEPREVVRTVDPYGVVLKGGHWYLVGAQRGRARIYRVSEIGRVDRVDDTFERPPTFDLPRWWTEHLQDFDDRRFVGRARVRMSPAVFDRLPHLVEPAIVKAARTSRRRESADGNDAWIRVTIPVEDPEHSVGVLLGLGPEVEVLGPPILRSAMRDAAAALHRHYGHADEGGVRYRGTRTPPSRSVRGSRR